MTQRRHYEAYRDSGVAWLGEVPAHWGVTRLKFVASTNDESLSEKEDPIRPITYVDISSVDAAHGIVTTEDMVYEDAPSRARRIVRDGDTIVSTVRTYLRAIAPVVDPPAEMIVSTGFAVIRARQVHTGYLSWALREPGFVAEIVARSTGVSYPAINASEIGDLPVGLPPIEEQRAIAAFLDRETAKVDALIEKKRLLIERLEEQRTALISRTVTRGLPPEAARAAGLDPSPRLKPSGVEWLGEVPEHWEVKHLKHVANIRYGLAEPPPQDPDGIPILRATNISAGKILEKDLVLVDRAGVPSKRDAFLSGGEILIVRSGAYTGDSAIVPEKYAGAVAGYDTVARVQRAFPEFIAWQLLSPPVLDAQFRLMSMRAAQQHLNAEEIGETVIALPPLNEQRAIASYIGGETAQVDNLTGSVEQAIERLHEYRTALITAAITGKIDVRDSVLAEVAAG